MAVPQVVLTTSGPSARLQDKRLPQVDSTQRPKESVIGTTQKTKVPKRHVETYFKQFKTEKLVQTLLPKTKHRTGDTAKNAEKREIENRKF